MARVICSYLLVFTLFISLYVNAQMSLFKRYVTILQPFQPPLSSLNHLCLRGECLRSGLADSQALMRRNRASPVKTIDMTISGAGNSGTSWQKVEYTKPDMDKIGQSVPFGLTIPRPIMNGVSDSDYMEVHKAVTPNQIAEREVRIHIHSEFLRTLDKFERKFYMVS